MHQTLHSRETPLLFTHEAPNVRGLDRRGAFIPTGCSRGMRAFTSRSEGISGCPNRNARVVTTWHRHVFIHSIHCAHNVMLRCSKPLASTSSPPAVSISSSTSGCISLYNACRSLAILQL